MKSFIVFFILQLFTCISTFAQFEYHNPFSLIDSYHNQAVIMSDSGNHIGAIQSLSHIIELKSLISNKLYLANIYFWRGYEKFEEYGIESAVVDYSIAANYGHKVAKEFFINKDKYGLYASNEFIKEVFKEKKLLPRNNFQISYSKSDSLRGTLNSNRSCYDVVSYDLTVNFNIAKKKIVGSNVIAFKLLNPTQQIQIDLLKSYRISKIMLDNNELLYSRLGDATIVQLPKNLALNKVYQITVIYDGKPPVAVRPPWQGGFVWSKDSLNNHWIAVACEHLGASSWWPNKDHLTDEPDSMKIALIVPSDYMAVSNGNLLLQLDTLNNQKKYIWKVQNCINNYNVTFYIGKFVNFKSTYLSHNHLSQELDYYVLPYHLDKAKRVFAQTQEVLDFYERTFGIYPFWNDGFGMVESPYAGMEHQGAIAYGSGYDHNPDNTRYNNKKYDYIIVHEAAHEWWGNSLTAGDMADVWLHEGFATYAEWLFLESRYDYQEYLIEAASARKQIINFFPIVCNRGVNDNAFAGWDIYSKGATVLHNLRCELDNDSLFFKVLKSFSTQYAKKIIYTEDFIQHVNMVTSQNFNSFFKTWLYQAKLPVLKFHFNETAENLEFTYHWENVQPDFQMCFGIVLNNENGKRIIGKDFPQKMLFEKGCDVKVISDWHPLFKKLPPNSFTYFEKKEY